MKAKFKKLFKAIQDAKRKLDDCHRDLHQAQERCPHKNTVSWTNNDGHGQFTVEYCEDCGDQKDGGFDRAK